MAILFQLLFLLIDFFRQSILNPMSLANQCFGFLWITEPHQCMLSHFTAMAFNSLCVILPPHHQTVICSVPTVS